MRGSRGMRHLALIGGLVAAACCGVAATAMAGDTYVAWKRQLGTSDYDYATGVATDADGNVYLTGKTYGSLADGNKPGADAFVAKYAADGHPLWKRQLGTPKYDYAYGVATDAAGNIYLAGGTSGSLGGPFKGGYADAFVAKYAADGHLLWKRQLGTSGYDYATGVATDAAGNVYLAGDAGGSLGGPYKGGYYDAFMAKYAADGHLLWTQQLGTADYEEARDVATDAAGNVYLTGFTYGSLGGAYKGVGDAWVAKYAADGQLLWTQQLGTPKYDYANGVATDAAGNVYLTGQTSGSLGGPFKGGYADAFVAKYAADGHLLWTQQLGTVTLDSAYGVATDAAGNVYLTGYTRGSLGSAKKGGRDAWVVKLDADGHRLWTRQPGTADDDYAAGVATDAAGNVYLTGYTDGSLGGANKGRTDAWVMKISPTAESAEEPTNGPAD